MVGIVSYGAYIPLWRLKKEAISKGLKGEKAIASYDEDSVTLAVQAALDCLQGIERETIDGLFFASTTSPYVEKQISTLIASALDLRRDIVSADFANSLRAGTSALKAAVDAVKAGSAKRIMIIASDCRIGAPSSEFERNCGDGAASLLIGDSDVAVEIKASYSIANEMLDVWRAQGDEFIRSWEDRFILTEGYIKVVEEAVSGLMRKCGFTPKDFSKVVFYAPDLRRCVELVGRLGFDPKTQLQDPFLDLMGNTGTAYSLMLLVAALEEARPGDRILLASYGNGSDVLVLEVKEKIDQMRTRRGMKVHLESKRILSDYLTYLKWRNIIKAQTPRYIWGVTEPCASTIWRERKEIYPLHGSRCKACGTIQYPPQRVCANCYKKDEFEEIRLSDKKGKLFSFSWDPVYSEPRGIIDFEGGGRMLACLTQCDMKELKVDMEMEMSFRKLLVAAGIHNYFWKAIPLRG